MSGSRRCARPGCRAWAMRGRLYCRAHEPGGAEPARRDAPAPAEQRELIERRVAAALSHLMEQPPTAGSSLSREIDVLRLVLVRVLLEERDSNRLAASIPRLVDATVRAVRAQQTLGGAAAENLTQALTQVLVELGLGEEGR